MPYKRSGSALRRIAALSGAALAVCLLAAGSASAQGGTAPPPTTTTTPPPSGSAYTQVFPIPTSVAHNFGDGFGASRGKRGHMGQDIFAPCGSPLIANSNGKIIYRGFHPSAGYYVVLRYKKLKQDYMYAHMQLPALVGKNQRVVVGQQLGAVGDTGNASGCHLHFELWLGRWYRGGYAIDPMPALSFWDSYS